jgi:membrane protease YdiL (CAAX protease family)
VAVPALGASSVRVPAADLRTVNALPSAGLSAGVALPSAAAAPASAPPAAARAVPQAAGVVLPAAAALPAAGPRAAAQPAALNDNNFSANQNRPAAGAVTAQGQLSQGAARIGAAVTPSASVETGAAALDSVFSGAAKSESAGVAGPASGAMPAAMGSFLGRASAGGQRQEQEPPSSQEPPRQSIGRSARVGFIAAVVPIAITFATMIVAQAVGYHFHAGYQNPFPQHMTAVTALTSFIGAAVLAPVSEELIFRGGIMGWLKSVTPSRFGAKAAFILPAVVSSLIFVSVHELSDPVLFATRFVHSMILSYAFHKEGYTGSIFAHGFFNGLLIMPMVLGVLLPGALAQLATFGLVPLSVYFAWRAYNKIRAERPDKKAGRLVAFKVSPLLAALFAAALFAGFFLIMGNIVWAVGALGWLGYALKHRAGRER